MKLTFSEILNHAQETTLTQFSGFITIFRVSERTTPSGFKENATPSTFWECFVENGKDAVHVVTENVHMVQMMQFAIQTNQQVQVIVDNDNGKLSQIQLTKARYPSHWQAPECDLPTPVRENHSVPEWFSVPSPPVDGISSPSQ